MRKNKIKQKDLAKWIGICEGSLSGFLNGSSDMGKASAKLFSKRLSRRWNEIIVWRPKQLKHKIESAYRQAKGFHND